MDKEIEYNRYNNHSSEILNMIENKLVVHFSEGSEAYPEYLKSPYQYYEKELTKIIKPNQKILDLCCGNGIHTLFIAKLGAEVTAVDIAENSIKLAEIRAKNAGIQNIKFITSDVEKLALGEEDKFDVITCVGSLSYLELEPFINNIKTLLKKEGVFICVDSFNHNPIYRLNRFIHYLQKKRSYSTLTRMPNRKTIKFFKRNFKTVYVKYFGIFAFLGAILKTFLGYNKTKIVIDKLDNIFPILNNFAFKIVIVSKL
ncbi:ubiquinone biosynthesis O-methyltransferase [mine drainage metagenome]|uniref:Ubiquinone biosynthesis O-methyltransferase n=1 Tax=mine drainage metagenome TaxID=410659 RepID=A0A1J5SSM1_9ZZZZ